MISMFHNVPGEMWTAIVAITVAGFTLVGVLIKNRRDDASVARELRDELREENRLLKEANDLLRGARDVALADNASLKHRVDVLENTVQSLRAEQAKWLDERKDYKRGLDKRDKQIADLREEIAVLRYRVDVFSEVEEC